MLNLYLFYQKSIEENTDPQVVDELKRLQIIVFFGTYDWIKAKEVIRICSEVDWRMPFEVVDIQSTPNPNAAKFVLNRAITEQPASFFSPEAAKEHAIASKLFAIPGVASLLLLGDFVTVNRQPGAPWETIANKVKKTLKEI